MSELKEVAERARALRLAGQPALLATLVSVRGSSYRSPGARLLINRDGVTAGAVSGGCLERDLARRGWWHTAGGGPTVVTYDSSDDDELGVRIGLGCNGVVDILLERLETAGQEDGSLGFITHCLEDEVDGLLLTVFRSTDPATPIGRWLAIDARARLAGSILREDLVALARRLHAQGLHRPTTAALSDGAVEALVEPIRPPPHLFVMGCAPDAVPLVALARALGWTTTVWDPRARFETRARFVLANHRHTGPASALTLAIDRAARPVAVVMSHDAERDREALAALQHTRARYVGVLGPRRRTNRLLEDANVSARAFPVLYAPAGLSLGAETAAEIALSIVSEIQAVMNQEVVGHLRDRAGSIHRSRPGLPRPWAAP